MDLRAELAKFKAGNKLFASMDDKGLDRLAKFVRFAKYDPNATIVEVGTAADAFFMIAKGGVRVVTDGKDEDKEVARLGLHGFFGETGILNDEPRNANVRAIGETHCLILDKEPFLEVLADYPQVMHALGNVGVERAGKLQEAQDSD